MWNSSENYYPWRWFRKGLFVSANLLIVMASERFFKRNKHLCAYDFSELFLSIFQFIRNKHAFNQIGQIMLYN